MPSNKVKRVKAWAVINKKGLLFAPETDYDQVSIFAKITNLPRFREGFEGEVVSCTITYKLPSPKIKGKKK